MSTLEELCQKLKKFEDFTNELNIEPFLNTIDEIYLKKDPKCIPILIQYFDDNCEYSWVLTTVRKTIEHFNREDYIPCVLKNLSLLLEKAPIWTNEIVNPLLNNIDDFKFFRENLHLASRDSLLKLFDVMNQDSPHHQVLIAELRAEVLKEG